ncbi:hypothetical protein MKW94_000254 [Papaver nudicaule]|uniref:Protein kinase domain-containing protein n=1 Tax=Papaver nudicaule TaxID=74823 RepID=A0AA41S9B9_PAPNU|nr:hypothetical protein [Papaver nudicaule]
MARFRYFSCFRSSKGETEGPSEIIHEKKSVKADQPKYLHCVANARESRELVVAIDTSDPGCVLGEGRLGREVAVKWFDEQADLSEEVQMLCSVEHSNLINMIGYCDKGKEFRVIVFEFMPLRSLNLHLRDLQPGQKPLDWKTRMKIAEGVAKALEYLHDQKDPPVIYSGLKTSHFGCAKRGLKWDYAPIHKKYVRGYGYIPTEYFMTRVLTLKSDVYGFGVVLLELISGEKAIQANMRGSGKHSILSWTRPLLNDSNKFSEIVDPLMKGQYPYAGLDKALNLAKMCVKMDAHERPPIAEVLITLSKIVSQIN